MMQRKWYEAICKYGKEHLPQTLEQELFDQYSKEPEFQKFSDAMDAVYEKYPNVMRAIEFHKPCQLNEEEVDALRNYLAIKDDNQRFIEAWYLGEILRLRCKLMLKE